MIFFSAAEKHHGWQTQCQRKQRYYKQGVSATPPGFVSMQKMSTSCLFKYEVKCLWWPLFEYYSKCALATQCDAIYLVYQFNTEMQKFKCSNFVIPAVIVSHILLDKFLLSSWCEEILRNLLLFGKTLIFQCFIQTLPYICNSFALLSLQYYMWK